MRVIKCYKWTEKAIFLGLFAVPCRQVVPKLFSDKIGHGDEIRKLPAIFNETTTNLEQSHQVLIHCNSELQVLDEIAETAALGRSVDAILDAALERNMDFAEREFLDDLSPVGNGSILEMKAA